MVERLSKDMIISKLDTINPMGKLSYMLKIQREAEYYSIYAIDSFIGAGKVYGRLCSGSLKECKCFLDGVQVAITNLAQSM